ncbi:MAG: RHS repeat-associated core domain-containing protein [Deltaproteobacteria bacterium]|nr:RHS repeat-associated core domain-containing protein [Deltaproteobacteria bacterium]
MGSRFWGNSLFFLCLSAIAGTAYAEDSPIQYFHSDHLGSASLVTNRNARVVESIAYTPFGEILTPHPFDSAQGMPSPSPQRGEERGEGATPYLFTGQEVDRESDLYNYGARFYDPALARFTSVDPILSEPPYAYVWNNPIGLTDPTGRASEGSVQALMRQIPFLARQAKAGVEGAQEQLEAAREELTNRINHPPREMRNTSPGESIIPPNDPFSSLAPRERAIMERQREMLNEYRREFGRELRVGDLTAHMQEASSSEDPDLVPWLFEVRFIVYYFGDLHGLRNHGGIIDEFNIVELDDGPMVFPAIPGASAPTIMGGNISTFGVRYLIYQTLAVVNLPWDIGRETLSTSYTPTYTFPGSLPPVNGEMLIKFLRDYINRLNSPAPTSSTAQGAPPPLPVYALP